MSFESTCTCTHTHLNDYVISYHVISKFATAKTKVISPELINFLGPGPHSSHDCVNWAGATYL